MNLDELTKLEADWLSKMASTSSAAYEREGVYAAWGMIFEQYVFLGREGNAEALKRALFLAWYGQAEPYWLCGIKIENFEGSLVEEVLQRVNVLLETDKVDLELCWMLPWYYHIAPYYLDPYGDLDCLKQASKGRWDLYKKFCLEPTFEGRGQLGKYWASISKKFVWGQEWETGERHF